MNILVITTFYPQLNRKDLIQDTSVVHYFAKEWIKQNHNVDVIHLYAHNLKNVLKYKPLVYGEFQEKKIVDGINVHLMENQFWIKNAKHYLYFQQKNISNKINEYFEKKMKDYKPDIILVHFPSHFIGIVENLKFECRKVAICHMTDVRAITKSSKIRKKLEATYDKFAARSICIKKQIEDKGIKVEFIANSGIDCENIVSTDYIENKVNLNKDKRLQILYAGSFLKRKNVDKIIKALGIIFKELDFEFTIIGDGKRKNKLIKLAKNNNILDKCNFIGRKNREDVLNYMRKSDLFIMISERETLGLTYLEAMSQGTIVIGSKNEGIDGIIIDKKNGFLVNSKSCEELSQKILDVSKLESFEKEKIMNNAILTIKNLTSEKVAKDYLMEALKKD